MLFRQQLTVWTDLKNLTFKYTEHASDRVLRQRLPLEEYGVDLQFIQGKNNEAADMLSSNEFIHKPNITVDTSKFEAMTHEMYNNELDVPIDYLIIHIHQRDYKELSAKRKNCITANNYKLEDFVKYSFWTKTSSSDGKEVILIPEALRVQLLE